MMPDGLSDLFIPAMAVCVLLILLLDMLAPPRRQPWRAMIAALTTAMIVLFMIWRVRGMVLAEAADDASPWLYVSSVMDMIGLLDFLVFVMLTARFRDRRVEARRYAQALRMVDQKSLPEVDVWIATMNETWDILEKTLVGAMHLDWPASKLHVHVLDDGRRPWLAARCAELGVGYITRPDNKDRKAGNHNNALGQTSAPFILSLDADFVVFPQAIRQMAGFFSEPRVAIVQSPQVFGNPEPFRNNLGLHGAMPDDLDLFYKVMQPGRDAWDAAFYCGTSAMLRRAALVDVGGFATQSDIEDQITSMKLWQAGWRTVFLGEQLSIGLAPESVTALHDQRNRWCRGSLQILFTRHGPFAPGFTLAQRLLFSQSYWLVGSLIPLWYAILPGLVLLFGPRIFAHAPPEEIIVMPLLLLAGVWAALFSLGERCWTPIVSPAFQLFMAVELLPTALASLFRPFGKPLFKILPVTAKGRECERRRVDWMSFCVLFTIILGTIGALIVAAFGSRADMIDGGEMLMALAWTLLNLVTCAIAVLTCFEFPYQRAEQRVSIREPVTMMAMGMAMGMAPGMAPGMDAGRALSGRTEDLSISGALVWVDEPTALTEGAMLMVTLPDLPALPARIIRAGARGQQLGLAFTDLDGPTRRALTARVYLGPERKPEPVTVRGLPLVRGLMHRFLRADL